MSKPLNEFGGWLVFFNVMLWYGLILLVIGLILVFVASNGLDLFGKLIYCIDFGISAFLISKIIKILRIKDMNTPDRVVSLMTWFLLLSIIFMLPELWSNYLSTGVMNVAETGKSLVRTIIWYLSWSSYFKSSKRVLGYYGKNTGKISLEGLVNSL